MKNNKILSVLAASILGFSSLLGGCSCKKDIDPSKAYYYLENAHSNLENYYKGNFSVVSTYDYDVESSVALLSNDNSSLNEEYNVVLTGNKDKKKFGEYVFDDTKILKSKYNVDDVVVSVGVDDFDVKETIDNAYDSFINSLYEENNSKNINEYIVNEAKKVFEDEFSGQAIVFNGELSDLRINSFLQEDVFTINYTYTYNVLVDSEEIVLLVGGKIQFNDKEMLYTFIELDFTLDGKKYDVEISHKYKDDFVDPGETGNVLSGLQSILDIDIDFFKKLEEHNRSFALVLYHESCFHCKEFVNSFNYSKNVVYKLEISKFTSEDNIYIYSHIIDYANNNDLPSNMGGHDLYTPAIIRFEDGVPKYISYGNVDFENEYNYNLLVSIIEGTFNGSSIVYQNVN